MIRRDGQHIPPAAVHVTYYYEKHYFTMSFFLIFHKSLDTPHFFDGL